MKKFNKTQIEELGRHRNAIDDANTAFETAANALKETLDAAADFLDPLAEEAQSFFDERSEKWQEGDAGCSYSAWAEALKDVADELRGVELELADDGVIERFTEMPTEPDE